MLPDATGALNRSINSVPPPAATVLAQICCFDNQLPQGAPTSPMVSNMLCARLDGELQRLATQYGCMYTRYADDITFSTNTRHFPRELACFVSVGLEIRMGVGRELEKWIGSKWRAPRWGTTSYVTG